MARSTMSRAVVASTSLPKGLQPRPMADTRNPELPSLRNCTLDHRNHFRAEASARFGEDVGRCVAAVAYDDDVVKTKSGQLHQALGDVLGRADDAEPIHKVIRERGLVACTAG